MENIVAFEDGVESELRARIGKALERLSAVLMTRVGDGGLVADRAADPEVAALQARIRLLGQLAAGLATASADTLPPRGAGFGTVVVVQD
ncbi:MAG: hypothetical protein ACT443_16015, partial [Gemmatimonadota bacterium]